MEYINSKLSKSIKIIFVLCILINLLSLNVFANDVLDISKLDEFSFDEGDNSGENKVDMRFQIRQSMDSDSFWDIIYREYKDIITGISGLITMTFVVFFIKNIVAMSVNSDNPSERKKASIGLLWTGLGLALTSGLTIVLSLVFYVF